jgi:hypothetical protein
MVSKRGPAPIQVDPEFRDLIIPLTSEETDQLRGNLQRDGCLHELVVWQETGLLLDGHNRHAICTELGIPFKCRSISLPDRDAAKIWMIRNQLGRRSLDTYQRGLLALELEKLLKPIAQQNNQKTQFGANPTALSTLTKPDTTPVHARKQAAEAAHVSEGTIHKIAYIRRHAEKPVLDDLSRGKVSVNAAYQNTVEKIRHRMNTEPTRITPMERFKSRILDAIAKLKLESPDTTPGDVRESLESICEMLEGSGE